MSIFDLIRIGCFYPLLIIKDPFLIGSIAKCGWQSYRLFTCSMCLYLIAIHLLSFLAHVRICAGMPIMCHSFFWLR